MRVVFCWSDISGYMASCWRALAALPEIEASHVLAFKVGAGVKSIAFNEQIMHGISNELLDADQRQNADYIVTRLLEQKPDVVVIAGWLNKAYVSLPFDSRLSGVKFIGTMDTPYQRTLRQALTGIRYHRYLRRWHRAAVPGERAAYFARRLGFTEAQIFKGLYGIDYDRIAPALAERMKLASWPKRFLYTGRYSPEKSIDVLLDAYAQYRRQVSDPWPLRCCGKGPLASMLQNQTGVEDFGFVQPDEIADIFVSSGVFVLPSRFDPWPLVIVEAAGAGLPVIHSTACGSAVECVRSYYSGLSFPTDDARSLAAQLLWMHENHSALPEMGRHGQQLAAPFAAPVWARRWLAMLQGL